MVDSQKMASSAKSGGQRMDDHSFWAGGMSKESPLPTKTSVKYETSANGAGNLPEYEDTTETIKRQQLKGVSQVKKYPMKQDYRY